MPIDEVLRQLLQRTQDALTANAARLEALQTTQETRLAALETAAGEQIRGLQAQIAEQVETLVLAGETMAAIMDVCRRHGYDPGLGLSALEWLEHVLDSAAAGWPSAN